MLIIVVIRFSTNYFSFKEYGFVAKSNSPSYVYTAESADYFDKLMPYAEKIIFDDCGHFIAIDKAEETAESIVNFFERHCNCKETQLTITEFD